MSNFEDVKTFMKTFGQEVKIKSSLGTDKINSLRLSLIQEELDELNKAISSINKKKFSITDISSKVVNRNPSGPFTTSTLQQTASSRLGFGASRTMQIAQKLYQGIEIEGETIGLITYMRTDGTNLSKDAVSTFRDYIKNEMNKPSYEYQADLDNAWTFYNHVTHALKKSHPRSWMTDQQKFHEFMITELLSQSQLQNADANIIDEIDPRQLNIIDAIENKSFAADIEAQDEMFGEFKI